MDIKRIENWAIRISNQSWFSYLLLILITAFAAGLRFYKLGEWSFWIDEIYTMNHAQAHFSSIQLLLDHIPPARNWVPTSVILTAQALNLFGISEWSARLVSALIGILSFPILYFSIKRIFGSQVTLVALFLLAVSPWHIYWSQNARFYTSLLLFYTLALVVFHYGVERNQLRYFFLFWAFVYLAFSERLFAFFIFPVIAAYLAALWIFKYKKPAGYNLRNLLLLVSPIIVGGMIEAYSLLVRAESRFFADFDWFYLYRVDDPFRLLGNIGFNLGIPLMVLAVFSGYFLIRQKSQAGLLMFIGAVVPLGILIVANPFIFTKDRYVFATLFSWAILAAYGFVELLKTTKGLHKWLAVAVFIVLFADAAFADVLYFKINHGNRGEWKAAFNLIKERGSFEDDVVAYWPEFGPYYLGREIIPYQDIDVATIINSENLIWFVLDSETIWINASVVNWLKDNARLIDIRYLRTPADLSLHIYLFDPSQLASP
jgi:mannosyltransferase